MDWLIVVNATEKFQISLPVKPFCSLSLHKNRKRYEFGWSERALLIIHAPVTESGSLQRTGLLHN